MKKYAHILLTTVITLSTTCMEKERKKTEALNIQSSSIVRPADSSLYSMSTLNGLLQPNPFPIPVIQRKYTDLDFVPVYTPVNTSESNNTNDIELTPIYRPVFITETERSTTEYFDCITRTKKTIPQEKQIDKNDLINQLYQAASQLYIPSYRDISIDDHPELIKLIILMNKAKQNNITEDYMGAFTYKKNDKKYKSLYFNCLKEYNNTKEELPFNADDLHTNPNLAQALNISCKYRSIEDINNKLTSYPAYTHLIHKIKKVIHGNYDTLRMCLHSGTKTLFNGYPQYNNITDFDSFYSHIHSLIYSWQSRHYPHLPYNDDIYNLLNLVEQIKKIKLISSEKDMCHKILNFNPTQTFKGTFFKLFDSNYDTVTKKNYIIILYTLVEKYNKIRGNKRAPTNKQLDAYYQQKELDIALPDNFNATLFDENIYAFTEFSELIKNIKTLEITDPEQVQQHVNQLYFQ